MLFREFLRAPTSVATITASSTALVTAMLTPLPLDGDPVVVELGAGTGRVTDELVRRLAGRGRHLAVELNPALADRLADRHPGVTVVCADAGTLPDVLRDHGLDHVDIVSSLLPWVAYAHAPIPDLAAAALGPEGTFTQVSLVPTKWMPPARRQERDLRARFAEFTISPTVWSNLPPARVLIARRPRRPSPSSTGRPYGFAPGERQHERETHRRPRVPRPRRSRMRHRRTHPGRGNGLNRPALHDRRHRPGAVPARRPDRDG